jgi:hypothetical protein
VPPMVEINTATRNAINLRMIERLGSIGWILGGKGGKEARCSGRIDPLSMQGKSFFPPVCCFLACFPFPLDPLRRRLTGNPRYDGGRMVLAPRSFPLRCDDEFIIGEIGRVTRKNGRPFGPARFLDDGGCQPFAILRYTFD